MLFPSSHRLAAIALYALPLGGDWGSVGVVRPAGVDRRLGSGHCWVVYFHRVGSGYCRRTVDGVR